MARLLDMTGRIGHGVQSRAGINAYKTLTKTV